MSKPNGDSGDRTDPEIPVLTREGLLARSQGKSLTSPAPAPEAPKADPPKIDGRIALLMKDPTITEIMINDTRNIVVERDGKLLTAGEGFRSVAEVDRLAAQILKMAGVTLNPEQPYLDAMLPDGSRVNVVSPPLTLSGTCITIRKFPARSYTANDLIKLGMMDQRVAYFLNACVLGRLNILISGGTGTGKTTLLSALVGLIPPSERIVTIEDSPEISVSHSNSIRMQTKPAGPGSPGVSARELVANSLRMRPDRVIVGECRRAEAFDMLQAMNTGHEGSMTTIHSNSSRDALSRLETLFLMAGIDLPLAAVRKQISGAVDLLIHLKRSRDGNRRVTAVSEITGMEGDIITLQDIFLHDGQIFKATGLVPTFYARLKDQGIELPNHLLE